MATGTWREGQGRGGTGNEKERRDGTDGGTDAGEEGAARGHPHRGLRRARERDAGQARALLRDALAGFLGEHREERALPLPGHPRLLPGQRRLRGPLPDRPRGDPRRRHPGPDAPRARRHPRGHRHPLPGPPPEAASHNPGGVRRHARPRLPRLAGRGGGPGGARPPAGAPRPPPPDPPLKLPVITQAGYAATIARAYNAWLLEEWCSVENGLLGCILACPHDPQDAAREIRRYAKEPGMVGVYLPCAGLDPLWGHRMYDPIFEAAQEADLPVLLHSATVIHPVFPFNTHGFETEFGRHICSHTFSMMANLVHMVTTGVPVRYPDLRIAFTEAGISWVPFLMYKMDKEYIERRREVPFLTESRATTSRRCT